MYSTTKPIEEWDINDAACEYKKSSEAKERFGELALVFSEVCESILRARPGSLRALAGCGDLRSNILLVMVEYAEKFDPERDVKFTTFFLRYCYNPVLRSFAGQGVNVKTDGQRVDFSQPLGGALQLIDDLESYEDAGKRVVPSCECTQARTDDIIDSEKVMQALREFMKVPKHKWVAELVYRIYIHEQKKSKASISMGKSERWHSIALPKALERVRLYMRTGSMAPIRRNAPEPSGPTGEPSLETDYSS